MKTAQKTKRVIQQQQLIRSFFKTRSTSDNKVEFCIRNEQHFLSAMQDLSGLVQQGLVDSIEFKEVTDTYIVMEITGSTDHIKEAIKD